MLAACLSSFLIAGCQQIRCNLRVFDCVEDKRSFHKHPFIFRQAKQENTETLDQYYTRLRTLSKR